MHQLRHGGQATISAVGMDRIAPYKLQLVSEAEIDYLQDAVEAQLAYFADAMGLDEFSGTPLVKGKNPLVLSGFRPVPDNVSMVLGVTKGYGFALDSAGRLQWCRMSGDSTISLGSLTPSVNPKWVLVAWKAYRLPTTPRRDGENDLVPSRSVEGVESPVPTVAAGLTQPTGGLVAIEGAEGGGKPAIPVGHVPIVDIQLTVGQTVLRTRHVDRSRARPSWAPVDAGAAIGRMVYDVASRTADNCRVVPAEPGSMDVIVRAGRLSTADLAYDIPETPLGTFTNCAAGKSRVDLVVMLADGSIDWIPGTETLGAPVAPSHLGVVPLAEVTVYDATTQPAIRDVDIRDVRPFVRAGLADYIRRHQVKPGAGAGVVVTLPWSYNAGSGNMLVFLKPNGSSTFSLVDSSAYTEASSTTVSIATVANANDEYLFLAGVPLASHAADLSPLAGFVMPGFQAQSIADNSIALAAFAFIDAGGAMRSYPGTGMTPIDTTGRPSAAWSYLYVHYNGSAVTLEMSATGPDSTTGYRFKTGDSSRVYLSSFYKSAAGKIRAFFQNDRHIRYVIDATNNTAGHPLNGRVVEQAGVFVAADVSLATAIPPHVLSGDVLLWISTGAASNTATVVGKGIQASKVIATSAGQPGGVPGLVSVDGSQQVQLAVDAATTAIIFVTGYST